MASDLNKNYTAVLQDLKEKIRQARLRATITVNNELLKLYWEIGNTILLQQEMEGWGTKVIDRLVTDLKLEFADMKGLSARNIKYMRAFAEAYPDFTIVQPVIAQLLNIDNEQITIVQATPAQLPGKTATDTKVPFVQAQLAQISWYHHITLLDKIKDPKNRLFYIQKTIENGWSRDVMVHQIESGLHKRQGGLTNNFQLTLPSYDSELALQLFKRPLSTGFCDACRRSQRKRFGECFDESHNKTAAGIG